MNHQNFVNESSPGLRGGELIDSLILGLRRDLKEREQSADSSHIAFIKVGQGEDKDEALERYYEEHPEARDRDGLVVFIMQFGNSTPEDGTKPETWSPPVLDDPTGPKHPPSGAIDSHDNIGDTEYPLPKDHSSEASFEEFVSTPQEEPRPHIIDIQTQIADGDEEMKRKYGDKVVKLADLRRQRGPWDWMI